MKKITIFALLIFLFSFVNFAQTPQTIEQTLIKNLKEVQKYSSYGSSYDDEKLSKNNEIFANNLLKYTKIASTLSYGFPALNKLMMNATSEDGKFRIYSWDAETGGTMHDFMRVYQFKGADGKVYSKAEEINEDAASSFVTDIFSLNTKDGKVYIVCSTFMISSQDNSQSADLFRIDGNSLNDKVKLIKTKSGLTNTLNFNYNFFSVVDRKERPIRLISFDKKTNTLKIPVVIEDKEFPNGRVTNKSISYQFNGTYFVKVS